LSTLLIKYSTLFHACIVPYSARLTFEENEKGHQHVSGVTQLCANEMSATDTTTDPPEGNCHAQGKIPAAAAPQPTRNMNNHAIRTNKYVESPEVSRRRFRRKRQEFQDSSFDSTDSLDPTQNRRRRCWLLIVGGWQCGRVRCTCSAKRHRKRCCDWRTSSPSPSPSSLPLQPGHSPRRTKPISQVEDILYSTRPTPSPAKRFLSLLWPPFASVSLKVTGVE